MKKLILISALAIASAFQTQAQTTNFFQTALGYFSSINTNLPIFQTDTLNVSAGTDDINNNTMAASLTLELSLYKFQKVTNVGCLSLGVESVTRNAGINGIILQQQGGVSISKSYYDIKATGYVDVGYDFLSGKWYPCVGMRLKKALTPNTYSYIGIEEDLLKSQHTPTASVGIGFIL